MNTHDSPNKLLTEHDDGPKEDAPMPWLTLTPEREQSLINNGFVRNRYRFVLRGKGTIEPGCGWYRKADGKTRYFTNVMALSLLHSMKGRSNVK